jgi:hypothetical protein
MTSLSTFFTHPHHTVKLRRYKAELDIGRIETMGQATHNLDKAELGRQHRKLQNRRNQRARRESFRLLHIPAVLINLSRKTTQG